MVCSLLEPRAAEWKTQTNPLNYGGTPSDFCLENVFLTIEEF